MGSSDVILTAVWLSNAPAVTTYPVDLTANHQYLSSAIPLDCTGFNIECTLANASSITTSTSLTIKKGDFGASASSTFSGVAVSVSNVDTVSNKVIVELRVDGTYSFSAGERYQITGLGKTIFFYTEGSEDYSISASNLSTEKIPISASKSIQIVKITGMGAITTTPSVSSTISAFTVNLYDYNMTKSSGFLFVKITTSGEVPSGDYNFNLSTGTGSPYSVTLTVGSNVVSHSVTYSLDGGSGTTPTQGDVAEGGTFTVASYDGTKDGFTFGGWNDGTNDYAAGSTYTMGSSDVTLTAVWNAVPLTFDYEVVGNPAALSSELPISVDSYIIKWSNPMQMNTSGGTVDGSLITVRVNGTITSAVEVSIDRATGTTDYAVIHLAVREQLSAASRMTISVDNQTGHLFSMGSIASVTIYTSGYSEGVIDLSGEVTNPLELDATVCSTGTHYITIRGITAVPTGMTCAGIVFDIPEANYVSDTVNNGFVQIPITTDNGTLTNGLHEVTVVVGNASYRFYVNIVNGVAPATSHDQDYVLSVQYNGTVSDSANAVLDIGIQKSANAANLEDMRLLVIAKYSGQYYVFNFYSKPVMDGNTGTDRIVLSKQDLSCVIVEVVDGIQTLDVTFYGVGTYTV